MESRHRSAFTDAADRRVRRRAHSTGPDAVPARAPGRSRRSAPAPRPGCRSATTRPCSWRSIVRAMGARDAVEVGTFTGYSALASHAGSGPDGHAALLRRERGVDGHRRAKRGSAPGSPTASSSASAPALDTLRALPQGGAVRLRVHRRRQARLSRLLRGDPPAHSGRAGSSSSTTCSRAGGVIDESQTRRERRRHPRRSTTPSCKDERVRVVLLPIGDGVSVVQKL